MHEWTQVQVSVCETVEQFIYKRHQVLYTNVQRKTGAPGNPGTGKENHTPVGHTHKMLLFGHTRHLKNTHESTPGERQGRVQEDLFTWRTWLVARKKITGKRGIKYREPVLH